ncbi:MAG: LemA family protein [Candidatus Woesearchaeota archaeon]
MMGWIIAGAVVIFLLFIWILYNSLIRVKNQVENAWAQIDVQLKRRADLIPNLIETVKGYVKHEKGVLTEVTKARTQLMNAGSVSDKAQADNMLAGTLKSLFAVAENYPDLKANQNFLQLQEELAGTENKVSYARQHYNDMVMKFNTKIQLFPNNIFANVLRFTQKDMFKASTEERKNVKVSF